MNSIDPAVNNPKLQPEVVVLDELAAIEKSLEGHPQRQEILEKLQKYQSQLLWQEQNKASPFWHGDALLGITLRFYSLSRENFAHNTSIS
jgi:hypothetical protein